MGTSSPPDAISPAPAAALTPSPCSCYPNTGRQWARAEPAEPRNASSYSQKEAAGTALQGANAGAGEVVLAAAIPISVLTDKCAQGHNAYFYLCWLGVEWFFCSKSIKSFIFGDSVETVFCKPPPPLQMVIKPFSNYQLMRDLPMPLKFRDER